MKKLEHSWKALVYDGVSGFRVPYLTVYSSDFSETSEYVWKAVSLDLERKQVSLQTQSQTQLVQI